MPESPEKKPIDDAAKEATKWVFSQETNTVLLLAVAGFMAYHWSVAEPARRQEIIKVVTSAHEREVRFLQDLLKCDCIDEREQARGAATD